MGPYHCSGAARRLMSVVSISAHSGARPFLSLVLLALASQPTVAHGQLSGRVTDVTRLETDDLSLADSLRAGAVLRTGEGLRVYLDPPHDRPLLRRRIVSVPTSMNIRVLLEQHGLVANAAAMALVRRWNESYREETRLPAGAQLVIPDLNSDEHIRVALGREYRVELTLLPDLKETLFMSFMGFFCRASMQMLGPGLLRQMMELADALDTVAVNRSAISAARLIELYAASAGLSSSLNTNCGADDELRGDEEERIDSLRTSLERISTRIRRGDAIERPVRISTLDRNGAHLQNLIVYYVPEWFSHSQAVAFPLPTSPTSHTLGIADYRVWAESPTNAARDARGRPPHSCSVRRLLVRPRPDTLVVALHCR